MMMARCEPLPGRADREEGLVLGQAGGVTQRASLAMEPSGRTFVPQTAEITGREIFLAKYQRILNGMASLFVLLLADPVRASDHLSWVRLRRAHLAVDEAEIGGGKIVSVSVS